MRKLIASVAVLATLSVATVRADFVATDTEPNNTFALRQLVPAGNGRATGSISSGDVDQYRFTFTPGQTVAAAVIAGSFDTILGRLSSTGTILTTDDDSGFGLLSRLAPFTVDASGQVNLAMTGFADFGLVGAHTMSGTYTVDVRAINAAADTGSNNTFATRQVLAAGINSITGSLSAGDVDFFTFTGLTPGSVFGVNVMTGPDTIIGHFSSAGALVASDDDGGAGLLSALASQTVGADGTITIAVTGFADFGFGGGHAQTGAYTFTVFALEQTGVVIPEPASVLLLSIGGLGALGYYRRRRQAAA